MDWCSFSNVSITMPKIVRPCIFLFIFFSMVLAQSVNSSYPNCPSYNCSNIPITYPFWRLDGQSTSLFCGYEGFGINCSVINGTELPNINLSGAPYHVKNINYNSSIISLVDYDVSNIIHVPNDCPRVRHTIDLRTLPFNFTPSNVNINFHFNCTGYPSFANAIPCFDSGIRRNTSVNIMNSETESFDWSVYSCDEEVATTVLREGIYVSDSHQGMDYVSGLRRGFELTWCAVEDCRKCEESQGRCGRYNDTTELICFCSDGTINQCNKGRENNWMEKVVIGVGVAVLSIVLICTVQYKKTGVIATEFFRWIGPLEVFQLSTDGTHRKRIVISFLF